MLILSFKISIIAHSRPREPAKSQRKPAKKQGKKSTAQNRGGGEKIQTFGQNIYHIWDLVNFFPFSK